MDFFISAANLRPTSRLFSIQYFAIWVRILEFYRANESTKIIHPLPQTITTVAGLIETYKPKGQSIFDYLLVATMKDHAISQIYTSNTKHFKAFDFLKVINAFT